MFLIDANVGVFQQWLSKFMSNGLDFFWSVVIALLVWFIGSKIIKFIRKLIRAALNRREVDKGVVQFTDSVVKYGLYIVLIIVILNVFGIQTSSVAAAVASLGLTAGLALQGSLSNLAGGVLILLLKPFKVGDYIIEDTHKNEGTVAEISIFYTRLRTVDNKIVVVPNGTLANSSLTNVTTSDRRQIDLTFGISYDDDLKKAKEILQHIAETTDERVKDTDIQIFVRELGASSVNLGFRIWVPMDDYWNVRWKLNERVKLTFDKEGITIPYDQLDVTVKKEAKK
ncbi:MAG: mechanosensitive ion channel family protein [Lachnospiraceae bacterium]|uniref:Mechanosensitive ion channel n=1 Tax=Candidatus Weimeria bifida TaxID=2599074 RepID=A0A6N7IYZ9_9FIRM|nr:mechanosensitive ion channel [Candidatus Weimeria bifida]RRF97082.1 MAG: mechanosensitive ion channel family protein [Lachnospiraceae bacterium]